MGDTAQKPIRDFTDLHAWNEAKRLAVETYTLTKSFPHSEQFGLTNQARRAAVSIAANIAEGFARRTSKDKRNFYQTALASLSELKSHLLIALELKFISNEQMEPMVRTADRTGKLLTGLLRSAISKT